jgi:hypothetical protein
MTARRTLAFAAALLLGLAAWYFLRVGPAVLSRPGLPAPPTPATSASAPRPPIENQKSRIENLSGTSHLADDLNAPAGTLRRDLEILRDLFEAFQTNFPRTGNPVGENHEIAAALAGDNPARFAFLPPGHRALNARGELTDRWGTPFRFHQLSGTQMEIRSAGPDKKFGTADDAELLPPAPVPVLR